MGLCWGVSFVVLWFHEFFFLVHSLINCVCCMSMVLFLTFYYDFVSRLAMLYMLRTLLCIHIGSVVDEWWWIMNAFENESCWIVVVEWMVVVNKFVDLFVVGCLYFNHYILLNEWWGLNVYNYWEESTTGGLYTNVPEVFIWILF